MGGIAAPASIGQDLGERRRQDASEPRHELVLLSHADDSEAPIGVGQGNFGHVRWRLSIDLLQHLFRGLVESEAPVDRVNGFAQALSFLPSLSFAFHRQLARPIALLAGQLLVDDILNEGERFLRECVEAPDDVSHEPVDVHEALRVTVRV